LLAKPTPRNVNLGSVRFAMFNNQRDIFVQRRSANTAATLGRPLFCDFQELPRLERIIEPAPGRFTAFRMMVMIDKAASIRAVT
jgi:hypothetical protein